MQLEEFDPDFAALACMIAPQALDVVEPQRQSAAVPRWEQRSPGLLQFAKAKLENLRLQERHRKTDEELRALKTRPRLGHRKSPRECLMSFMGPAAICRRKLVAIKLVGGGLSINAGGTPRLVYNRLLVMI